MCYCIIGKFSHSSSFWFWFRLCMWGLQCHEPVIRYVWSCYEWAMVCCRCVMIRPKVCLRLYAGMLTCCFRLKVTIVFSRVCTSWSLLSFMWILMSPMIIRSWCLGRSFVSRSVNWSMKLLLLNFVQCSVVGGIFQLLCRLLIKAVYSRCYAQSWSRHAHPSVMILCNFCLLLGQFPLIFSHFCFCKHLKWWCF